MVKIEQRTILLETENHSYLMHADKAGNLLHLYYGPKIDLWEADISPLAPKHENPYGCTVIADPSLPNLSLDDACLEVSSRGKGDFREPFVEITYADGSRASDFRFRSAEILAVKPMPQGLPGAYSEETQENQSVKITLQDQNSPTILELYYTVFADCDCITRFSCLKNPGNAPVTVEKLMSVQLDFPESPVKILHFNGDWAREMQRNTTLLSSGRFVNASKGGSSSNKANPFLMIAQPEATETSGYCYAANLIYSGDHEESAEICGHGITRLLTGLNPSFLSWELAPGMDFYSPEAVITCSDTGYRGISRRMHTFVREHIVRGYWKHRQRPILLNSWEAMYFGVQERKVIKLAETAKKVGIELFVLDDGWFGKRNDDTSSLGDWFDNKEKLPGGLSGLSAKIKAMGLKFGIWVEPEMVNENSELYRKHPDWVLRNPNTNHALSRNQMVLDIAKQEVQDYIIEAMSDVFSRSQADYVKWDMNRNFSDIFSQGCEIQQGAYSYRYMQGLYRILDTLTRKFPKILFEACAAGGNRFDLGMLCYMPQIWASDCTDAYQRAIIQNGYSYGYPQSTMGSHISASPNHQTLRKMPLETRFAIACGGVLGYECNLSDAKPEDLEEIKEEIILYKRWRQTLQFGQLYRLNGSNALGWEKPYSQFDTDHVRWIIVSDDQAEAVGIVMQNRNLPNFGRRSFRSFGLKDSGLYHFYNRSRKYDVHRMGDLINTVAPTHIRQDSMLHHVISKFYKLPGEKEDYLITGSLLNRAGIMLAESFCGTGMNGNTAIYQDNDARLFFMEEIDPE